MNTSDLSRNLFMLKGKLAKKGYDWWWHSFTGYERETGKEQSFYIEYYVTNPKISPNEVVLGQEEENKKLGKKPSYFMLKVGAWGENKKQLHNFYPISEFQCDEDKLNIKVGNNELTESHMKGKVEVTSEQAKNPGYMCDAGSFAFDLKIDKQITFNVGYGASKFFRKLNAFEMFWHAEGMKTQFEGEITYDGKVYEVIKDKSYGYSDKNWGGDFTSPWVWISSCNLTSKATGMKLENSAFDIGGGRPKAFGIPLNRKLLIDLYYEGQDYEFNFAKFWTHTKTKFNCYETETQIVWEITTKNKNNIMELVSTCDKIDMLNVNYESPKGLKRHNRLWNGGNGKGTIKLYTKGKDMKLIDEIVAENIGCEYGEYTK
jgi:hypothetical protein